MKRLTCDHIITEMSKAHPPIYSIREGETVTVETLDCRGGMVGKDGVPKQPRTWVNPATGPIEIKGSQPGDAIAVTIHTIRPADWGFIGGGGQEGIAFTPIQMHHDTAIYPWGLRLPLDPMIGVIGLAPAGDPVPTTTPGEHGGNLDTTDVGEGATIYLPVAVPGGMLALGDVHALQGDAECGGTGIECAAEVTLSVRIVKDPLCPTPYLVRNDTLVLIASAETLDEAAWNAVRDMAKLLSKLTGLSDVEARRLLSTAGEIRISQIVNPKKTCRAIIPKAAIPDHWPF